LKNGIFFAVNGYLLKSDFMNQDFSQLNLIELCDKLSECTELYSKSMMKGFSDKEFFELRALIEALQKEIARRKPAKGGDDDSSFLFPPQQSASA
jgi:hypothetical protein